MTPDAFPGRPERAIVVYRAVGEDRVPQAAIVGDRTTGSEQ